MDVTPERQDILNVMEIGHSYSPKDIAVVLGKKVNSVTRLVTKLESIGLVKRVRYGRYILAENPVEDAPPARITLPGVYLLKCNDLYKIGCSDNVPGRVAYLVSAFPYPAYHIHTISSEVPRALEATLHEKYADKRVRGEWFALDMFDVDEICSM